MKKWFQIACVLGLTACTNGGDDAAQPTPTTVVQPRARITAVRGEVKVKLASAAQYATASMNLKLYENDKILTGRDGHATITFANGQVVMLTPESLVAIQKPEPTSIKTDTSQTRTMDGISVESGRVDVEIDPRLSGSLFRVKTPDAEGIVPLREMEVVGGG